MLFAEPHLLFSVSFQLSFAAVTALVLAAPRLSGKSRGDPPPHRAARLVRYCAGVFLASLVASAATLPLVAFHFQRIPLVGPAVNVAAVPLTGFVVLPLGWAALAAQALCPVAADLAADAASWACRGLILLAHAAAGPSWISVAVPRPPPLLVAALLGPLLAGSLKGVLRAALCALAALVLLSSLWWAGSLRRTEIRMSFFDVGQGEAALLQLPGGEGVLVDTGPAWEHGDAGRSVVVPALRKLGVTSLDALVISHFHPDHCGGLLSVMSEIPVKELWVAPLEEVGLPPGLAAALHRWEQEGGKLRTFTRGDTWRGREGVRIDFLNPPKPPYGGGDFHQSMNDNSLVFLLSWEKIRLLMTGDAGTSPILDVSRLLPEARGLSVLKIPHHGGRQAGTADLARSYVPRYAVISVGRNSYGHPDPEVVEVYGATADVLRTDREGGVFLSGGGSSLKARTWRQLTEDRTWSERARWLLAGR
jgi:competence protein ComEC